MDHRLIRSVTAALAALSCLTVTQAHADGNCTVYATDYANSHSGNGDPVGDMVSNGMTGAVAGGAWAGPGGAVRGARAGAALGVLNNMGSYPGGWQALYDMAYQMCQQQQQNAAVAAPSYNSTYYPDAYVGSSQQDCRSTATVNAPLKRAPDGTIMAGSGYGNCR